jgi:hypothetical protein
VPEVLILGNSLIRDIDEQAPGNHKLRVTKIPAQDITTVRNKLLDYDGPTPKCIAIQAITNEVRDMKEIPKVITQHCLEAYDSCLDIINNKWPECKSIIGLAPPRGDSDRNAEIQAAINCQLRRNLKERSVDYMELDDFGYNLYPYHELYSDHIHFNRSGVSMYASRLKRLIAHTVIGIDK